MIKLIRFYWHAYQRWFDLKYLWPECVAQAKDLDQARAAFMMHCRQDPAWMALGPELFETIDHLEPPHEP